jgi:ERO1-like protein alpha
MKGNTNYLGEEARKLWRAIYTENCFKGTLSELCTEQRVFYKLISGFILFNF